MEKRNELPASNGDGDSELMLVQQTISVYSRHAAALNSRLHHLTEYRVALASGVTPLQLEFLIDAVSVPMVEQAAEVSVLASV